MLEKLIVMLTHNDVTVKDAKEIFEENKDLPVTNWGFKDVGLEPEKMKELCGLMKAAGKTTFLEVVTYSEEECMRGAKLAVECGFDCLLGTLFYDSVAEYVKTTNLKYYPFVGLVSQSPSILEGSCDLMLKQAEKYKEAGACGVDLLGYRYVEGDPNQKRNGKCNGSNCKVTAGKEAKNPGRNGGVTGYAIRLHSEDSRYTADMCRSK